MLALFTVGDVYASLCKRGACASSPVSRRRWPVKIRSSLRDILPPGVALTSNLAVIFTLNQYSMQNLEKVLFTGPKTSDTVTFICD